MTSTLRILMVAAGLGTLAFFSSMAGKTNMPTPAATAPYPDRLTVADVMKVTGWSGVKFIPRGSRPNANGDLNFVNRAGNLILTVRFGAAAAYKKAKSMKDFFFADVKGLADDAFQGPAQEPHFLLCALKGKESVVLSTHFSQASAVSNGPAVFLTQEHLQQLAKILLKRL